MRVTAPGILLPESGASYVQMSFSLVRRWELIISIAYHRHAAFSLFASSYLNVILKSTCLFVCLLVCMLFVCFAHLMQNMWFSQVNNIYPNYTAALDPKAPAALANAFADVFFLPHNAVSINSYNYFGYSGGDSIFGYWNPSATATLTVLYQGTGLVPSVDAITYAFYEAIKAVTLDEQSPLGNALIKYGFPNAYSLNFIDGYTASSTSYTADQPTPAPTVYRPPTVNHGTTILNATSVGDNVTTISHLNYQPGENFYWYIKPPTGTAKGAKLTYTVHFPLFSTNHDYLHVGVMGNEYQNYCTGSYCADTKLTSTAGVTLSFFSYSWSSGEMTGFIAQVTWQIYKPRKLLLSCQHSPF